MDPLLLLYHLWCIWWFFVGVFYHKKQFYSYIPRLRLGVHLYAFSICILSESNKTRVTQIRKTKQKKQNKWPLCPSWHRTHELTELLELKAQISCTSCVGLWHVHPTGFFFRKWEDLFSLLGAPVSRPLLKDKLGPEESRDDRSRLFVGVPIC